MSIQEFISLFIPFIFTGLAIYISFFLAKLDHRIGKKELLTVWLAMSLVYVFFPYAPVIFNLIPFAIYFFPSLIIFFVCLHFWKLEIKKAVIYSIYYGLVNLIVIASLNYLFSGVLN